MGFDNRYYMIPTPLGWVVAIRGRRLASEWVPTAYTEASVGVT